ncbi:MAG: DUF1987 domain-containing protein [Tenuifilaceae bacterium]|jgi:hypothetical protein|uniref:DUF1987 domain-containing protein n=1 Tax=Perlabentimonas gracilis TaxID=2715279 RepID=UPI00140E90D6|nr:DUF1987 domain-containing protein [Perlabentimonas gracilis]MDX9770357.1 DUF1987 domain-containing protein [Tenuifilaceae bacterium]NHB69627.1 DUF1987 domain-containing protein [Perlabentimonas gracilis]
MKPLKIEAAIDTPEIIFDPATNIFSISGISHPENAKEFYEEILDWLDEFYQEIEAKKGQKIIVDLNFKYINSSSYKYLREIMKKVANIKRNGVEVEVIWNYQEDDEDLLNEGMVLFELPDISLDYRCIPYN